MSLPKIANLLIFIIGLLICLYPIIKLTKNNFQLQNKVETQNIIASIVAHDLATPISILDLLIHRKPKEGEDSETHKQRITYALEKIKRILLKSREVQKKMMNKVNLELESCSIYYAVNENIEKLKELIEKRKIQIHLDISENENVLAEKNLLSSNIIESLLENAILYSPEDSTIKVYSSHTQDTLKLSFENTGYGLDEGKKKKLELTNQLLRGEISQAEKGCGLGWIQASYFSFLMGGNLEVESVPEQYTRVHLYLKKA